jgi:preprotein translocase SecE subunit
VARDRQRSKQRRRAQQPGAGGPAAGSASTHGRDIGLEPTDTDLSGTTPAPEPTKHASPYVEEAHMAEAGVPAPDIAEHDTAHEEAQRALGRDTGHRRPNRGRLLTFLGHVVDELRRVQWPDRRQVGQGTLVTLGFVVVAGSYLGLLDAIWKPLVEAIL